MKRLHRLFGLRLRDGIAVCLIWVAAGSACCSTWLFWRALNRYTIPSVAACRDAVALASACSNYCVFVSLSSLTDSPLAPGATSTESITNAVPVVLGYGQTKSPKARYIYKDTRMPDGTVRRDYIARFPSRAGI